MVTNQRLLLADSVEKGSSIRESGSPPKAPAIPTYGNCLAAVAVLLAGLDTRCGIRLEGGGGRPVRHAHDGRADHSCRIHKPHNQHTARDRSWPKSQASDTVKSTSVKAL
ncbi:hypothetical protein, partial [Pseudomonas aeruginosa]|uniref:hypothetical protein n=1 Tax=Pseudomonas aeruginosa TaxID=287 RepID=UPI001EDF2332